MLELYSSDLSISVSWCMR